MLENSRWVSSRPMTSGIQPSPVPSVLLMPTPLRMTGWTRVRPKVRLVSLALWQPPWGLSMVVFFGLAATDTKKKWYNMVFSGILFFAAISQVLIFTLFSSSHCGDQFWADFLSLQEQQEESASTTCEMGTGGWFAIVAFVLFLFSALLVATKWLNPGYKLFTMEWTKDHTGDPGRIQRTGNDEEAGNRQLQSTEAKELLPPVIEQTMTDEEDDEHHEYHHGGNKPDPSMMVNY